MDEGERVNAVPATSGSPSWDLPRWGAALGASAAMVIVLITACGTGPHVARPPGRATVVAPPQNASAADVVRAYVAALNRHDVAVAASLLTAQHLHTVGSEVDSWFTNVRSITGLRVGTPVAEATGGSGDVAAGYKQAMRVPVTFTLQQEHVDSLPNGVSDWGYLLVRNTDAQPWRIADEGMG